MALTRAYTGLPRSFMNALESDPQFRFVPLGIALRGHSSIDPHVEATYKRPCRMTSGLSVALPPGGRYLS